MINATVFVLVFNKKPTWLYLERYDGKPDMCSTEPRAYAFSSYDNFMRWFVTSSRMTNHALAEKIAKMAFDYNQNMEELLKDENVEISQCWPEQLN